LDSVPSERPAPKLQAGEPTVRQALQEKTRQVSAPVRKTKATAQAQSVMMPLYRRGLSCRPVQ
jgi:hypothetical protein